MVVIEASAVAARLLVGAAGECGAAAAGVLCETGGTARPELHRGFDAGAHTVIRTRTTPGAGERAEGVTP